MAMTSKRSGTCLEDVFVRLEGKAGKHVIDMGKNSPVKQRPYRMSAEGHRVVEQGCKEIMSKGVIWESKSPWSSQVVLVTKKNGDASSVWITGG